jgi:hypothetical protein
MPDNLNIAQFGDEPKKRWVPDQTGHSISWHILKWHTKANIKGAKSFGGDGIGSHDYDQHHKMHMRMHEDGKFEVGHDHEHFTPKKGK